MKILLVNKYWHRVGGVEKFVFEIHDELKAMGHEVIPFAMAEPTAEKTAYSEYFPSHVDLRGGGFGEKIRGLERSVTSIETIHNLRRLVASVRPDRALVVHAYHQRGLA